jgi:peptidoglycan/LPS O-acetylase OafA/YrhL
MAVTSRQNNFDFLRLIAAIMVVCSHAYGLFGISKKEPLCVATGVKAFTAGTIAVHMFFAISGFLIVQSCLNTPSVPQYLIKRFVRIWPGLACCLTVCIGWAAIISSLPFKEFIAHPQTLQYLKGFLIIPMQISLPGIFAGNPVPDINGSLWTLGVEFFLYIVVAFLKKFQTLNLVTVTVIGLTVIAIYIHLSKETLNIGIPYTVYSIKHILTVSSYFFIGGALYFLCQEKQLSADVKLPILALAVLLISVRSHNYLVILELLLLPYITIWFALYGSRLFHNIGKYGDFSYGIYLYAFPIEQSLFYFLRGKVGFIGLTSMALALSFLAAFGSWFLVEKRAIGLVKLVKAA